MLTLIVITLGVGQRSDILVTGIQKPAGTYMMRSTIPGGSSGCSTTIGAVDIEATAVVWYDGLVPSTKPTTKASSEYTKSLADKTCVNVSLDVEIFSFQTLLSFSQDAIAKTTPWFSITPDPNPPTTQVVNIGFAQNASKNWLVRLCVYNKRRHKLTFPVVDGWLLLSH